MAWRLGEYVVYGEIWNTGHYSTHGGIVLRGEDRSKEALIRLALTGDCDEDLRGKHIRFWPAEEDDTKGPIFRPEERRGLQYEQIGPTGTMTAAGWARTLPCPVEEFMRRAHMGEPPPTTWERRLYLEWFSQNGRLVIELAGALVEECVREPKDKDDEAEWAPLPNPEPRPSPTDPPKPQAPEISVFSVVDDDVHIEQWGSAAADSGDNEGEDEPASGDLQQMLDAQAAAIERSIRGEGEGTDDTIADIELLDHCIEQGEGEPLTSFLPDADKLPRPENLDDTQVEAELKCLLARLAMINVTLDVCDHFTPRDCYKLLLDTILPESSAYEELIGTSNIQHESTYEYCPKCAAEIEEEYRDLLDK